MNLMRFEIAMPIEIENEENHVAYRGELEEY